MCVNKFRPYELVTVSFDCTFNVYDIEKATLLNSHQAHEKGIWCCDHSIGTKVLAMGSNDCSISLWGTESSAYFKITSLKHHEEVVYDVQFSQDGNVLASCSKGLICLWDVRKFKDPMASVRGNFYTFILNVVR